MSPSSPLRLYGAPLSGHAHRAQLLLSLLDLPYEYRPVDLAKGEQRTPAFLALNPFGTVPVLDLPGVGKNLQDHLNVNVINECKVPITLDSIP